MAGADLDTLIRKLAKQQHKSLMAAAKAGRNHYLALAGKAKDAASKQRYRQMAKHAPEEGTVAAKRLQISADNAADSYARAMRRAAEAVATDMTTTRRIPAPKTPAFNKTPALKTARTSISRTAIPAKTVTR